MTLKELFKKVEAYNEIAALMGTTPARIFFNTDPQFGFGEYFENFTDMKKYIKEEYIDPLADMVLKYKEWDFDKQADFLWTDSFGDDHLVILTAELAA